MPREPYAARSHLAKRWQERLIKPDLPGAEHAQAAFLDSHDFVASKLAASRLKDLAFALALVRAELIDADVLLEWI